MNNGNALTYNDAFFTRVTEPGLESARIIVPRLLRLVRAQSVIDIGCGLGAWLKVFQENGVKNIRGLDGNYIDQSRLLIDANYFNSVDLAQPIKINVEERYDLAICLEVAEHLPASAAPHLVRALTRLSPFVPSRRRFRIKAAEDISTSNGLPTGRNFLSQTAFRGSIRSGGMSCEISAFDGATGRTYFSLGQLKRLLARRYSEKRNGSRSSISSVSISSIVTIL
jgi:hypothetical protein